MPKRNGTGIALLADDTRRRIIAHLALRPSRPTGIARAIGLSRPATSRQLRLLSGAGLIRGDRSWVDGRGIVYRIDPDAHGRITAWLAGTEVGLRPDADRTASPGVGRSAGS
jgi:DNA-binding transcriptional ArsR family regulator